MKTLCKFLMTLPKVEGEKDGNYWVRQQFVCTAIDGSERKMAFTLFGERRVAKLQNLKVGMLVEVIFNIESRQGADPDKWFTDLSCVSVSELARVTAEALLEKEETKE